MIYSKETIYIMGISRISKSDPISDDYNHFFIGIILEKDTGIIVDSTCNMVRDITTDFIRSILVGYSLKSDLDKIVNEVNNRFFGMAQKAVLASIKDARNKYIMILNN